MGPPGSDTNGTQLAVQYGEVSIQQWYTCTQLYVLGTAGSVLPGTMIPIQR